MRNLQLQNDLCEKIHTDLKRVLHHTLNMGQAGGLHPAECLEIYLTGIVGMVVLMSKMTENFVGYGEFEEKHIAEARVQMASVLEQAMLEPDKVETRGR